MVDLDIQLQLQLNHLAEFCNAFFPCLFQVSSIHEAISLWPKRTGP